MKGIMRKNVEKCVIFPTTKLILKLAVACSEPSVAKSTFITPFLRFFWLCTALSDDATVVGIGNSILRRGIGCLGLKPVLAHGRLDIGDFEVVFVVADRSATRSMVHGNALDAGHPADSFFDREYAQYRQHVVYFNNARFHIP